MYLHCNCPISNRPGVAGAVYKHTGPTQSCVPIFTMHSSCFSHAFSLHLFCIFLSFSCFSPHIYFVFPPISLVLTQFSFCNYMLFPPLIFSIGSMCFLCISNGFPLDISWTSPVYSPVFFFVFTMYFPSISLKFPI